MQIIIKSETDSETNKEIIFTNEELDNDNFVDIIINNKEHIVNINELLQTVEAFYGLKKKQQEQDAYYKSIE